ERVRRDGAKVSGCSDSAYGVDNTSRSARNSSIRLLNGQMGGKRNSQGYRFARGFESLMSSMNRQLLALILAICFAPAVEAAETQGTFEVRIKDHREAIGDFSQLNLTVGELLISPKPGFKFWQSGWKSLPAAPEVIDLTKYVGNNSLRI